MASEWPPLRPVGPREKTLGPISLPRPSVSSVWGSKKGKIQKKNREAREGGGATPRSWDQLELPHAPMGSSTSRSRSHWLEGLQVFQVSLLFEDHGIPTLLCHSAHRIAAGGTGLQIRTTPPGLVDTPCLPGLGRGCPGSKWCDDHSIAYCCTLLVRKGQGLRPPSVDPSFWVCDGAPSKFPFCVPSHAGRCEK